MASPCIITYKGKEYSYEEWATALHDGLLDTLVKEGTVSLEEKKPEPTEENNKRNKALLGRAFRGTPDKILKSKIEGLGLQYEIESHKEAQSKAKEFVKEVGYEDALHAVRTNMVEDGAAAFVWAEIIDKVNADLLTAKDAVEQEELRDIQKGLLDEFDRKARSGGRFISALKEVYQNSEFNYDLERQIDKYKSLNNGEIPADVEKKMKEMSEEMKALTERIKELESQQTTQEEQDAIANIEESVKREKPITNKEKAKRIANAIRRGKVNKPSMFNASTPGAVVWDSAIEVIAQTIETTGSIADAIKKGIDVIKKSNWYKGLSKDEKLRAESEVRNFVNSNNTIEKAITVVNGKIIIPHDIIRKYVAEGINDMDELVGKIKSELKEDYPNITDRQIRDAITKYGKTVNLNKEEIEQQIRKMKRIGRITSALEDIAQKKRPLRSGMQRDTLDAEERKLVKDLKEAISELPIDDETQAQELKTSLDAVKSRLRNQIGDLEREIATREKSGKSKEIPYDEEAKALVEERDRLKAIRDDIFGKPELTEEEKVNRAVKATERAIAKVKQRIADNELEIERKKLPESPELNKLKEELKGLNAELKAMKDAQGITEKRRLENAKKTAAKRIQYLQDKIAAKDFSKKKVTPIVADTELLKLRADKMRIQDEFDKLQYENELKNRTKWQKAADYALEAWNLPRALRATSELSFILLQGGTQTLSHPKNALVAMKTMFQHMASEKAADEWLRKIKLQDYYADMKASKLAITEVDHKLNAREEMFISGWANHIWDIVGLPLKLVSKGLYEGWTKHNVMKMIERGGTAYLNMLRLQRYLQGVQMLEMEGKTMKDNAQDYKNMADAINTLTGRASLGKAESISKPLSVLFFSPRMWASQIKLASPYAIYYAGRMHSKGDKWYKPSVAQKMIVGDLMKRVALTAGTMAFVMAAYNAGKDDDDEDRMTMESDPRSSNFGKLKIGNTTIDPWGGQIQQIVLLSRFYSGELKKADGKVYPLGTPYKTPTYTELLQQMATNKLAPSASMIEKLMSSHKNKEGQQVDKYGNPIDATDMMVNNLYPIFVENVKELWEDQPSTVAGALTAYSFLGGGANTYKPKEKKEKQKTKF